MADPDARPVADASTRPPDEAGDARDYDCNYYLRVLRDTFAARLARAFAPEDFVTIFADPEQPSLFGAALAEARPILTVLDSTLTTPAESP